MKMQTRSFSIKEIFQESHTLIRQHRLLMLKIFGILVVEIAVGIIAMLAKLPFAGSAVKFFITAGLCGVLSDAFLKNEQSVLKSFAAVFQKDFGKILLLGVVWAVIEMIGELGGGSLPLADPLTQKYLQAGVQGVIFLIMAWVIFAVYEVIFNGSPAEVALQRAANAYFQNFLKITFVGTLIFTPLIVAALTYVWWIVSLLEPGSFDGSNFYLKMYSAGSFVLLITCFSLLYSSVVTYVIAKRLLKGGGESQIGA